MFPELHSKLGMNSEEVDVGFVNVLEEEDQLGAFLVHHFLSLSLRSDRSVVMVGVEQSLGHYHAVSLKLGCNLAKARERGQVCFVEWLREAAEEYSRGTSVLVDGETSSRQLLKRVQAEVLAIKDLRPGIVPHSTGKLS